MQKIYLGINIYQGNFSGVDMEKEIEYIKKAVFLLGGQSRLAKSIGVTQGAVWKWVHGHKRVSPLNAVAISKATGGQVRASDIRPDLLSFYKHISSKDV